jgi:hypothetical protein
MILAKGGSRVRDREKFCFVDIEFFRYLFWIRDLVGGASTPCIVHSSENCLISTLSAYVYPM